MLDNFPSYAADASPPETAFRVQVMIGDAGIEGINGWEIGIRRLGGD